MGILAYATVIITFMFFILWFLLWTWFRYNRYIKKRVFPDQWKVLGIIGLIFLIIIIIMITLTFTL